MAKIKFDLRGDGKVGPQRLVSFYDLMQYPEYKQVIESGDESKFEDMLWELGVNTKNDSYEIVTCSHRPLTKTGYTQYDCTWYGPAVIGSERIDSEYIQSGYATWEAKVAALTDPSLRAALNSMGKQAITETAFN